MTKPGPEHVITEVLAGDTRTLRVRTRTIQVEVTSGPNAGHVAELCGPEARIGSGKSASLVLFDPAVSRHHLSIRLEPNGVRVLDAGSRNGTTLDGVRVKDAYARDGSIVVVGGTSLRLRLTNGVVDLPLSRRERFGGMIGQSVAMRQLFTLLERIAPTDDSVLVQGETGSGKELVAEAIHEESHRSAAPFVVFDCSAVTANLLESELFGHVRGAFTGALQDRVGAFEAADGGTLFLDEIGELPIDLQPKLLRVLERREVRRVGSNDVRPVDVRIVAATNRDLEAEVAARRFREDLFFRLAVIEVDLPPLRARPDDVPLLVDHFAEQLSQHGARGMLPEEMKRELAARAWPGNVRELRNAVARALSLGTTGSTRIASSAGSAPDDGEIDVHVETDDDVDLGVPFLRARESMNEAFEEKYFAAALRATGGNATRAADLAGVNRKFMQRAIKRHRLREKT